MPRQQENRFLCGMCTYSTDDDRAFLNHYGDQHKREMAYWCRECGRTFTSPAQLVAHIKNNCTKIKSVTMKCGVANCTFSGMDPFQFMQHIKIVHKGTHLFPCFKCRKLFTIPSCLIQHIQTECAKVESKSEELIPLPSPRSQTPKPARQELQVYHSPSIVPVGKPRKASLGKRSDEESDPDDPYWRTIVSSTEIPAAKKRKGEEDGSKSEVPQRYERWNDWWKAVSACKSPTSLESLLKEENLRHFFTCMSRFCQYSTDDETCFVKHQTREHPGEKLPCRYCLREIDTGVTMARHSVSAHGTRRHQCSGCLYRASTKSQVALHFEAMHEGKPIIYGCRSVGPDLEVAESTETEVAMPYICRVGRCKYETCNPEEFVAHNRQLHTGVSVYPCFYCGAETFKLDALMRHYRLHGIYNFQCAHCVHGTNTIEEILFHQCLNHAERRMQVYVRPSSLSKNDQPHPMSIERNPSVCPSYPMFFPDYAINFSCGVEGCQHMLCDLDSYRDHLLNSHYCSSFFPCPHCTEISITAENLEDHLVMHGPNLYACGSKNCVYSHWKKSDVELHCRKSHKDEVPVVIRESLEELVYKIKKEPPDQEELQPSSPIRSAEDSRINFQLQVQGSFSVQGNVNLGESMCSFGGEDNAHSKRLEKGSNSQANKAKNPEHQVSADVACNSQMNNAESPQQEISADMACNTQMQNSKSTEHQVSEETMFCCPFCEYTAATHEALVEHVFQELEYDPFQCDFCDVKEVSFSRVQKHILDAHPQASGVTAYSEIRNEIVESWLTAYLASGPTNLRRATRDASERFCNLCCRMVSSNQSFRHHLADHLCYRPRSCVVCKERFFTLEEARAHALMQHDATQDGLYSPIPYIEKWLDDNDQIPMGQKSSKRKMFKCYYCNFGPSKLKLLKRHFGEFHSGLKLRARQESSPCRSENATDVCLPHTVLCEKCGHVNFTDKRSSKISNSYGKPWTPIDLSDVWVLPPQPSAALRISVEDLMKILNFNVCLSITDLKKSLYQQ